jgi:hypothetical protein
MKVPTLGQTRVVNSFARYKGQAENALYGSFCQYGSN